MLLGEILIQKKLITPEQLEEALEIQRETKAFLGAILVERRFIRESELLKALSEQFKIPVVNLKDYYIDWEAAMKFSSTVVCEYRCLPVRADDKSITVAITNPLDAIAISKVEQEARDMKPVLILVTNADMDEALKTYNRYMSQKIRKMLE